MRKMITGAAALCALAAGSVLLAQNAPSTPAAPAVAARGGGNRAPVTAEEAAEIAKANDFPVWTPGAGDGNYSIGPEYAPAPEQTPREDVPKGRVETFTLNAADSTFYPDTGLRGA